MFKEVILKVMEADFDRYCMKKVVILIEKTQCGLRIASIHFRWNDKTYVTGIVYIY